MLRRRTVMLLPTQHRAGAALSARTTSHLSRAAGRRRLRSLTLASHRYRLNSFLSLAGVAMEDGLALACRFHP